MSEHDYPIHRKVCERREKQKVFEQSLRVICPLCKKAIIKRNIQSHLQQHLLGGDESAKKFIDCNFPVICPFCGVSIGKLAKHLKEKHPHALGYWAKGLYDSDKSKKERKVVQESKRWKANFVQGGAPSLGKSRKY
jgi:hypothetical protein